MPKDNFRRLTNLYPLDVPRYFLSNINNLVITVRSNKEVNKLFPEA